MNQCRRKICMRCVALTLLIVSAATLPKVCYSQATDQEPQNPFQRELRKRVNRDQAPRLAIIRFLSQTKNKKVSEAEQKKYMKLLIKGSNTDQSNLIWLKKQIATNGFPSYSALGNRSGEEFFLLVVHADRDRKFQKRCLESMKEVDLGWPQHCLRQLEYRVKRLPPPTIKLAETQLKQLTSPTTEIPDASPDEEERPSEDERPSEGNE